MAQGSNLSLILAPPFRVDTAVRRVWELDAEFLEFTNPRWELLIDSIVDEIAVLFSEWRCHPQPRKLAITLDHRHTRGGLTLGSLKGTDRSRAEVLFETAGRADCVAHLALVTLGPVGLTGTCIRGLTSCSTLSFTRCSF